MRLTWRITEVWQKALYIVGGWVALALLFYAMRTWLLDPHGWLYAAIGFVVNLGYTLLGVRTFRGYLEPVAPPRQWWRWTGRPRAGFWIGWLQLLTALFTIPRLWPRHGITPELPVMIFSIVEGIIVAFGYLNSSFRLRRRPELWSQRRRGSTIAPS